jgi:glucan phosphoethanolaminetransferase (alkaline phosphatase superfamily)
MGEFAQAIRANVHVPRRTSYRWIVSAALISLVFAVVLLCVVFLFNIIPNAMHSAETGWTDFTEDQLASMKFWYLILLVGGIALIFLLFYLRRSKDV